jgi:restriction system protein
VSYKINSIKSHARPPPRKFIGRGRPLSLEDGRLIVADHRVARTAWRSTRIGGLARKCGFFRNELCYCLRKAFLGGATVAKSSKSDPKYTDFMIPIIEVLKQLDGSGMRRQVFQLVADNLGLSESYLAERLGSGELVYKNRIDWAKYYLAKAGYLDTSKAGVWELTEKALNEKVDSKRVSDIVRHVKELNKLKKEGGASIADSGVEVGSEDTTPSPAEDPNTELRRALVAKILETSPTGFEKLCMRLLEEYGFEKVKGTPITRDGGIDGQGILYINPFYSVRVVIQCKRYTDKIVGIEMVHQFAGAISSASMSVDKGILFTASSFTQPARQAAEKTSPQIELVDMEGLIDMFLEKELGYETETRHVIKSSWFSQYVE